MILGFSPEVQIHSVLLCSGLDPFAFIYLVYSALLYF